MVYKALHYLNSNYKEAVSSLLSLIFFTPIPYQLNSSQRAHDSPSWNALSSNIFMVNFLIFFKSANVVFSLRLIPDLPI